MRLKGKVDANQKEIVSVFRKMGLSVVSLANLGGGVPDLLVGSSGNNYLFEVKDGSKPPSKQKLTPDEEAFFKSWLGQADVVNSTEQAIDFAQKIIRTNLK